VRRLEVAQPIVFEDGTMQAAFRDYMNLLSRYIPLTGSGNPEGVTSAPQYSIYIDTAGSGEYRKMLTDIGGDTSQGWVLI